MKVAPPTVVGPLTSPSRAPGTLAKLTSVTGITASDKWCGRDKGMPNGGSFNWENMTTGESESLETRCVESLLVVYVCVLAISSRCQKTVPPPVK
jgi:hypothetical protein